MYSLYIVLSGHSLIDFYLNSSELDKKGLYIFQYISFLFLVANLLFFYKVINKRKNNIMIFLAFYFHLLMSFVISISFHDRKWAILHIFALLATYNYSRKRLGFGFLALTSIGATLLLTFLLVLRNAAGGVDSKSFYELFYNHVIFGGVFGYFDYFAYLIKSLPDSSNILHAVNYMFTGFFPSVVVEAFGFTKEIPLNIMAANVLENTAPAPAFSLFGEGYLVAQLPGIIFLSLLAGLGFSRAYNYFVRHFALISYLLFFIYFFLTVRTGVLSSISGFILFFAIYWSFSYLSKTLWIILKR